MIPTIIMEQGKISDVRRNIDKINKTTYFESYLYDGYGCVHGIASVQIYI